MSAGAARWPRHLAPALLLLAARVRCEVMSGDTVYLVAHTGAQVGVDEQGVVWANASTMDGSQDLVIERDWRERELSIHSGDVVYVRTQYGRYLDVENSTVRARWYSPGAWQALTIERDQPGAIVSGDVVYFRAHTGRYIEVEGALVQARWPDQGDWQAFHILGAKEKGFTEDLFHGALDIIGTGCGFVNLPDGASAECNKDLETDCTEVERLPKACRPECPFIAPHPQLSCVFSCRAASNCSRANAENAYPNNETMVCEPCEVVGCRECSSKQVCKQCFDNFWLEFGGRACLYVWDERAQNGVHAAAALMLAVALLASSVLVIADRCRCCGKLLPPEGSDEEESEEEDEPEAMGITHSLEESPLARAVRQGKRHRLRCKVKDVEEPVPRDGPSTPGLAQRAAAGNRERFEQVPLCTDLRSKFLIGVGLPLFHQWYPFLFIYALLMFGGTLWVYRGSELGAVLQRTGLDHASAVLQGRDAMELCGMRARNSNQLGDTVSEFARRAAVVYLALWILGFVLSLVHALRQKHVAADFYKRHPCLAEFAVSVEGFPPDATDEARIRNFLRDALGAEALEVSVCYDYRSRRHRVNELLEKIVVQGDVQAGAYPAALTGAGPRKRALGLTQEDRHEVLAWLRQPCDQGGLRNAGQVFAVFPHNYDLQLCRQRFEAELGPRARERIPRPPILPHQSTPRWLPEEAKPLIWVGNDGKMHELIIRDVVCEPPDVQWENLGTETPRLVAGYLAALVAILVSFVSMTAAIFVPLAAYIIQYINQAGSLPNGVMMTVLGTLVMAANWVMCFIHSAASSFVGFARRDREGLLVLKVFASLCLVNFLFNVTITLFPEGHAHAFDYYLRPLTSEGAQLLTTQSVAFQARVSLHLFHVLVPGSLFIGYIIWPLQGFVWPFVSTLAYLRCWPRCKSKPLTAREAERALLPLGISIPHDYMGHIVQPFCCSLTLFFASDVAWQTFACLVCWSIFMIPFMRYLHFRAVRRCYFTTNRLDSDALFLWSLPLSLVLAASCFWAARLRGWPLWVVPVAWVGGVVLFVAVLSNCVGPLILPKGQVYACHRPSYDQVRTARCYDWHNCNPIKVLLSHCVGGEGASEVIMPFEVGKEYLQLGERCPERPRKFTGKFPASEYRLLDQSSPPHDGNGWFSKGIPSVPEVETLISGPLDALGAFVLRRSGPRNGGDAGPHSETAPLRRKGTRQKAGRPSTPSTRQVSPEEEVDDEIHWPSEAPESRPMPRGGWPSGIQPL